MIEAIAQQALPLWGFDGARITLVAQRENTVFRLDAGHETYALRLHRADFRSDDELQSELMWMQALSQQKLTVPGVKRSLNNRYVEVVNGVQVDVLTWVSGRPLGARGQPLTLIDRNATFYRFGAELARLHYLSDNWTRPSHFTRKSWDIDGLFGDAPQWGRFWENPALSRDQAQMFATARDKARTELQAQGDLDYGLIHADLVPENVLLDGDQLVFIDFDDGGPGFRLYDIATALLRHQPETDYASLEAAFLAGYRSLRALDTKLLPLFFMAKACAYVGWTMARMQEPANAARNDRFITTALPLVRSYLGQPDL